MRDEKKPAHHPSPITHHSYPFRIGATSCVFQGDILSNVLRLAPLVDDIELVLFDVEGYGCNFPDPSVVSELRRLQEEFDLSYTVHLPADLLLKDENLEKAFRAISTTRKLEPFAYVMHFDGRPLLADGSPETVRLWCKQAKDVLAQVVSFVGEPEKVCVENLERWDPERFDRVVAEAEVCRCVDVGHLWFSEREALPYLRKHLPKTRVVHLHRDHRALVSGGELGAIAELLSSSFDGVVTLEVFSEADLFASLALIEQKGHFAGQERR